MEGFFSLFVSLSEPIEKSHWWLSMTKEQRRAKACPDGWTDGWTNRIKHKKGPMSSLFCCLFVSLSLRPFRHTKETKQTNTEKKSRPDHNPWCAERQVLWCICSTQHARRCNGYPCRRRVIYFGGNDSIYDIFTRWSPHAVFVSR